MGLQSATFGERTMGVLVAPDKGRWDNRSKPDSGLALRVRDARQNAGLTQEKAAEKLGLSPGFIAMLEIGQRGVSRKTLQKMAKVYGANALYLETGKRLDLVDADPALAEIVGYAADLSDTELRDLRDWVRRWVQANRKAS